MIDQVMETIRSALPARGDSVTADTPLRVVVRDSIDAVELIAVLTEEYRVRIDLDAFEKIQTLGDVARYVTAHAGEAEGEDPLEVF